MKPAQFLPLLLFVTILLGPIPCLNAAPCWKTIFERNEKQPARQKAVLILPFANGTQLPEDDWIGPLFPIILQDYLSISKGTTPLIAVSPPSEILFDPAEALKIAQGVADYLILGQFSRQGPVLEVSTRLLLVKEGVEAGRINGRIEFPGTRTINDFLVDLAAQSSKVFKKLNLSKKKLVPYRNETLSAESLRFFVLGTLALKRNSPEGVREAVARFEESIRQDYNYLPAYLGLATALVRQGFLAMNQGLPHRDFYSRARQELEKARLMRSHVAERKAEEIEPYLEAETYFRLGESYAAQGNLKKGLEERKRAARTLRGDMASRERIVALLTTLGKPEAAEPIRKELAQLNACGGEE